MRRLRGPRPISAFVLVAALAAVTLVPPARAADDGAVSADMQRFRATHPAVRILLSDDLSVRVYGTPLAQGVDASVAAAFAALRSAGAALFNQSVLLAGVNDDEGALADLSEALFAAGAIPYYLHMLDRVAGAAHFDVPTARARLLMAGLRARLPGYLVPRLVRETAGAPSKLPVELTVD